jgi:RHS repeat-associated protein
MSQHRYPAPWRNRFSAVLHAPPRGPDAGSAVGKGPSGHEDPCRDVGCLMDTQGDAAVADPHQYTAHEYDAAAGLQYNRATCYDARPRRWLTLDPAAFG